MTSYSLTITTDSDARQAMLNSGYNLVFAKGVSTGSNQDFNAAWFVIEPQRMASTITVEWTVSYEGNFTLTESQNGVTITENGNDVGMAPGKWYNVYQNGQLQDDPDADQQHAKDGNTAFNFINSRGYENDYIPVLKTQAPTAPAGLPSGFLPIWTATAGVPKNGTISVTPVEMVRVWAGKYDASSSVLANYATQPIQFDLTTEYNGFATLLSDLSGWTGTSSNAKIPTGIRLRPKPDIILFSRKKQIKYQNPSDTEVIVTAVFIKAVTLGCVTWLLNNLIKKFGTLKPKKITVSMSELTCEFDNTAETLTLLGTDAYQDAVDAALKAAQQGYNDINPWNFKYLQFENTYA